MSNNGPALQELIDSLAEEGWRGFTLLRRYLAENRGEARALARQLETVPWSRRGDLEARRVRWAFLADTSTLNFRDPLLLQCLARGVVPVQYHAPPGRISREVRDPESGLWAHKPGIVVVAVSPARNPGAGDLRGDESVASGDAFVDSLAATLRLLRDRSDAVIIVNSFLAPEFRPLGLQDWRKPSGLGELYSRLNLRLYERCRDIPGTHVADLSQLALLSGARWWTLHKPRLLAKLGLPEEITTLLCDEYAAVGAALRGLVRKCLVVDLDDTLWGGVVGEGGASELLIGGGHPGNIYRELQEVIHHLHQRGVILAINSRNDEQDAWQPFEQRREMVLQRQDFAAWRINWRDKATNLRDLSEELRIGLDGFVVLDDDPLNRRWIEEQLPEVHVLPAQDPLEMLRSLSTTRLFEGLDHTDEDGLRARSYAAAPRRRQKETLAADREAFLVDLNLVVTVGKASPSQLPRLAQLTQRTNQFNLTTRRYTLAELERLSAAQDWKVLYCSCRDRFADEGIAGLVILQKPGPGWVVHAFLLSCRVLGWGVERALAAAACRVATEAGAVALEGQYIPTGKNRPAESFYRDLGFSLLTQGEGGSTWRLTLPCEEDLAPRWVTLRVQSE